MTAVVNSKQIERYPSWQWGLLGHEDYDGPENPKFVRDREALRRLWLKAHPTLEERMPFVLGKEPLNLAAWALQL